MVSEMSHARTMLAIKRKGKNESGTSNHGWEYNIKTDIKKNMEMWAGLIRLRVGIRGVLL
jgi:hypothetical protein